MQVIQEFKTDNSFHYFAHNTGEGNRTVIFPIDNSPSDISSYHARLGLELGLGLWNVRERK